MLDKIKTYLGVGFLAFLSILGLVLKSKSTKIKELELTIKKDAMEKDLQDARNAVKEHHEAVKAKEERARVTELNYRQAMKEYRAAKEQGANRASEGGEDERS